VVQSWIKKCLHATIDINGEFNCARVKGSKHISLLQPLLFYIEHANDLNLISHHGGIHDPILETVGIQALF